MIYPHLNNNIIQEVNPKENRYVVLIMGQSNIDNRNPLTELPSGYVNPTSKMKIYSSGWENWDCASKPEGSGNTLNAFSADFIVGNDMADYLGESVYVVKESHSGSRFYQSNDTTNWNIHSNNEGDFWQSFRQRILNCKNYVEQAENRNFVPICLWTDIFESDSRISNTELLRTDYTEFITAVRDLVGTPDLPIIHREVSTTQTNVQQFAIDLQNEFVSTITNYSLIPWSGLTLQDGSHLDTAGTLLYASRVVPIMKGLYDKHSTN